MIASLVATVVLSQAYSRSRMVEMDPTTQCLWWKENTTITWRSNVAGNDETPGETEFIAASTAFSAWDQHMRTCSSLRFVEGPKSTSRLAEFKTQTNALNENLVLYRQRACRGFVPDTDACVSDGSCGNKYDCWQFSAGAIAITTTSYNPRTGQILDSDIELNTPSYIFTTVNSPPCVRGSESVSCVATDIQNTMTHEVGHLLGLSHINDSASTMNPSAVVGELTKRTIDPGSKRFVCDIYKAGGYARTCIINRLSVESAPMAPPSCSVGAGLWWVVAAVTLRRWRR